MHGFTYKLDKDYFLFVPLKNHVFNPLVYNLCMLSAWINNVLYYFEATPFVSVCCFYLIC